MANLVVCCDGTWNTPAALENGRPAPTNVVKIANALAPVDTLGRRQQCYYHPGVGTEGGFLARLLGGGLGKGLDQNIQSAYRWLAQHYAPGDDVFLFGFSRGAYTVRSLCGMIAHAGLLDLTDPSLSVAEVWRRVGLAYDAYRGAATPGEFLDWPRHPGDGAGRRFAVPPIHFIGVWDTVGSLGIPDDLGWLTLLQPKHRYRFHDTSLGGNVANARHALAIDEAREDFRPTLWTGVEGREGVQQVWFSGCHSDVGGGFADTGLSDGALRWMMEEAAHCGLHFRSTAIDQLHPDPRAYLHDALKGVFRVRHHEPRAVPPVTMAASPVHASVRDRADDPPLHEKAYWPATLVGADPVSVPVYANMRWNPTGIVLEGGVRYRLAAEGEWIDWFIHSGPDGAGGPVTPSWARWLTIALEAGPLAERLWRRIARDPRPGNGRLRRRLDLPWMTLVGAVANGAAGGNPARHEEFGIGSGRVLTPKATGYLYAYANDLWPMYFNNRGSVRLTVTRLDPVPGG